MPGFYILNTVYVRQIQIAAAHYAGRGPGFFNSLTMSLRRIARPGWGVIYFLSSSFFHQFLRCLSGFFMSAPRSAAMLGHYFYRFSGCTGAGVEWVVAVFYAQESPRIAHKLWCPGGATRISCLRVLKRPCFFAVLYNVVGYGGGLCRSHMPAGACWRCSGSRPQCLRSLPPSGPGVLFRRTWFTSCWYWPTPMLLGSIFTSSASGSIRRAAYALPPPRMVRSSSGKFFPCGLRGGVNGSAVFIDQKKTGQAPG